MHPFNALIRSALLHVIIKLGHIFSQQMTNIFSVRCEPQRLDTLDLISSLEQCEWHDGIMRDVFDKIGIATLDLSLEQMNEVIPAYIQLCDCDGNPVLYSTADAAAYLGISEIMMKKYVFDQKRIRGTTIGRTRVFTKGELDRFNRTRRPRGNPNFGK